MEVPQQTMGESSLRLLLLLSRFTPACFDFEATWWQGVLRGEALARAARPEGGHYSVPSNLEFGFQKRKVSFRHSRI